MRILITTMWTDRNKGDAALNIAAIRIFRRLFPSSKISICSVYGANQINAVRKELFLTKKEHIDTIIGNPFPTHYYYATKNGEQHLSKVNEALRPLRALLDATFAIFILLMAYLNLLKIVMPILPQEFRHSLETFLSADLVVSRRSVIPSAINAGTSILIEPYILFKSIYDTFLSVILRKTTIIIGCSVWPLLNPISKLLLKWVLSKCALVVTREDFSRNYIKHYLKVNDKKVLTLPDLSIFLCGKNKWQLNPYPRNKNKPVIGFTFVDWHTYGPTERANYVKVMTNFIRYLKEKLNAEIIIIPQVTYPPEDPYEITKLIVMNSGVNAKIIHEELSIDELLRLYASCDFVIATPLHSAVFSLCVGTPVISIAYDGGFKHIGIMEMLGMREYVLSYHFLSLSSLIEVFNNAWVNKEKLHNKILKSVKELSDLINIYFGKNIHGIYRYLHPLINKPIFS